MPEILGQASHDFIAVRFVLHAIHAHRSLRAYGMVWPLCRKAGDGVHADSGAGVFVGEGNFEAVSLEMSQDWQTAPLFVRPSGNNHPRAVFDQSDVQVRALLMTWASK